MPYILFIFMVTFVLVHSYQPLFSLDERVDNFELNLKEISKDLNEVNNKIHNNHDAISYELHDANKKLIESILQLKMQNKELKEEIKISSSNFESQLNNFKSNILNELKYKETTLNETIKKQAEHGEERDRLLNEIVQTSLKDIRRDFNEELQKKDNQTSKILMSLKDELKNITDKQSKKMNFRFRLNNTINTPTGVRLTLKDNSVPVSKLTILNNGDLATGGSNNTIKIWNTTDGSLKMIFHAHQKEVLALATLQNGNLISGSSDGCIAIWSMNYELIKKITNAHNHLIGTLTVFHNGNFASGSNDKIIKIWTQDGYLISTLKSHTHFVMSIIVLPNDDFVSASYDGKIIIWSADGKMKKEIKKAHSRAVFTLTLVNVNGDFASGSQDKSIKLWSKDGEIKKTINVHNASVNALATLPNGDLACGFGDGAIKIIDENGVVKSSLNNHTEYIWSLIVIPDGELASASGDTTVKIWSA